jgi:pimeloyl-ACP methyl ester carboxylesterase
MTAAPSPDSRPPLVLIPGLQGRWEWMQPAVEALARHYQVITFSLCDERRSGYRCDPVRGFENYVDQVGDAMSRVSVERAIITGVSYGGLIATEFAARHPERVWGLVLVSALPIGWQPDARARRYLRSPTLMSPMFVATSRGRLRPEVVAALPDRSTRLRFLARHGLRVASSPMSPTRMARRLRWAGAHTFADPARIAVPARVITGEPGLDRVVPVEATQQYLSQLRRADHVVLEATGHVGLVTKPGPFVALVNEYVESLVPALSDRHTA